MSKHKGFPDPDEPLDIDFHSVGGVRVIKSTPHGGTEEEWNFGWAPELAVVETPRFLPRLEAAQGHPAVWEDVYKATKGDSDQDWFAWEHEKVVRGGVLLSWGQGSVGSCVSFGWGRGGNDLLIAQAANGEIDFVPEDVATEPIYGGSRVEVGGGRLGSSDGSLGSWAADWCLKWGLLLRKVYGPHDLTKYSEAKCRQYGSKGCPDDLEPEAKLHPIQSVALVTSADSAWQALGIKKVIPICSNYGFDSPLRDGFCEKRSTWNHCMLVRGRFIHASKGKCVVIQNSWLDYLKSLGNPNSIIQTRNGPVQLPQGCFATTLEILDGLLRQRDSYVISSARGYPERNRHRW